MLAVNGMKMSDSKKKVNKNTYDTCPKKRVIRKFPEVSRCSRAKQRQRNVQKIDCAARAKVLFCQLDLLSFFLRSCRLSRLALHDFIFCLSKL